MKNLIKKLAAGLIVLGLIAGQIALAIPTTFADDKAPAKDTTAPADDKLKPSNLNNLKNLEFKVQDYLKLPKDPVTGQENQSQSYFGGDPEDETQTKFPLIRFILDIIDVLVKLAGTIAVLLLIITGFVMIFSQGEQNTIEKAKQMFGQEIIGLVVILLSYVLVTIVQGVLTT